MRKVVGEWQLSRDELIQVDVSLRFGEEPESGQRSMFQSGCSNGGACEYARVRERPVPALRIVEEGNDRQPDNSESSEARAKAAYARIEELVAGTPKEILQRLRQYPIYTACFITDFVRAQEDSETEKWRERLTQALLYDWIQHDAVCRCSTCRTDQGVPIARVTLWRKFGRSDCCRVLLIQNNPPFRRPIQSDCQPLVADKVSIRHLVGQPLEGVRRYLTHDNITLEEPAASSSPSELRPRLDAEIGRSVRPETIDLLGSRYFLGIRNG